MSSPIPDELKTAEEYVTAMAAVIGRHFRPDGPFHGRSGAFALARSIGYGFKGFPPEETAKLYGSLYSRLIVRNTFGHSSGVPVNAKEFVDEVRAAEDYDRQHKRPLPEGMKRMK